MYLKKSQIKPTMIKLIDIDVKWLRKIKGKNLKGGINIF